MQFIQTNIFYCVTWWLIITNICARDTYVEADDNVQELAEKLPDYLDEHGEEQSNHKLHPRNEKKLNSQRNKILKIKIQDDDIYSLIELKKVDRYLANKHLPIWKSSSKYPEEFHKLHNVMRDVGDFTMYHDYKSKSALVHFHDRDELDGIIHRKYYIRKLPRSKLRQVQKVNDKYVFLQGHAFYPIDNELTESEEKNSTESKSLDKKKNVRVSREAVPEVYPELLIAIGFDMFTAIETKSKSAFAVNTVSHVLVVLNAVDMLYQSVKSAKIKLNIAGIVIEASEDRWDFLKPITIGEVIEHGSRTKYILDAENITAIISNYFRKNEDYFPRDSYDFIIYNTRHQLTFSSVNVMGMAWHSGFSYMYPFEQNYDRINLAAQDHKSYAHYVVLAHEIAHMMNVEHDPVNGTLKNDTTLDSIMSCYDSQCVHGLSWSEATEKTFKRYFRSPAHCILRNHPRSLHPPKPRKTLSALEQCQCYGFDAHKVLAPDSECDEPVVCLDDDDELMHVTQKPMDGTPCGHKPQKHVCWKEKCVDPNN